MSIIVAVHVPEGIVMAADSRLTRMDTFNGLLQNYVVSDNAQKVFLLNKEKVGLSYCGSGFFDGLNVPDFINKFQNDVVLKDHKASVIAYKLMNYLKRFPGGKDTTFLIAGYDHDEVKIFEVKQNNLREFENIYQVIWHGEPTAITKLMLGNPPLVINYISTSIKDAVELAEFLVQTTINYQRFDYAISTCGGSVDILVITKEYARFVKHKILNP